MKIINNVPMASLLIATWLLGLIPPQVTLAATTPSMGTAATFGILSSTYTNTVGGTTINGDLGYTTGPAVAPTVSGTTHQADGTYNQAGTDQNAALADLNSQACDFNFGSATDLSLLSQPLASGVYCVTGAATIGSGGITLNESGTYIFRISGALTTAANSSVTFSGSANVCDLFWTPTEATTLGANSTFGGTNIDAAGITIGSTVTWTGRALAFGGTVSTETDTINVPSCTTPPPPSPVPPPSPATLHVVKTVVNNNGGTAIASNFTLNVAGTNVSNPSFAGSASGVDVTLDAGSYEVTEPIVPSGYLQSGSGDCSGSIAADETKTCTITNDDIAPQLIVNKVVINDNGGTKVISNFPLFIDGGSVTSGVATTTTIGSHTVSETADSGYTATIGGDCAANGTINLALGDVKTCTVTNDDIAPTSSGGGGGGSSSSPTPPLIAVVKVPSPLALPDGPGAVKYTYTLSNIGKVSVNDITMVGDTCSPITLISGDTDADTRLDVNETWVYTCSTTLSETHTNIVTATGWANGISATDIANSTVVVGIPVVPPLIHVTKVPSPLVLGMGGGIVTYTNKVTNPGIVALSNVRLTDDKCGPVQYISGDTNIDSKLDVNETWVYTCATNLTKTTVNTVTASGDANGLSAKDFAIVTVVVSDTVPKLPDTGLPPSENNLPWTIIMSAGIFAVLSLFYFSQRKHTA